MVSLRVLELWWVLRGRATVLDLLWLEVLTALVRLSGVKVQLLLLEL